MKRVTAIKLSSLPPPFLVPTLQRGNERNERKRVILLLVEVSQQFQTLLGVSAEEGLGIPTLRRGNERKDLGGVMN